MVQEEHDGVVDRVGAEGDDERRLPDVEAEVERADDGRDSAPSSNRRVEMRGDARAFPPRV